MHRTRDASASHLVTVLRLAALSLEAARTPQGVRSDTMSTGLVGTVVGVSLLLVLAASRHSRFGAAVLAVAALGAAVLLRAYSS